MIHTLKWGQHLTNAQRNCRTFLYGICAYMIIYILLKNLQIHGYLGSMYDVLYTTFIVVLFADISVMAYLYRNYYGRNILHELGSKRGEKEIWYYDPMTHKYSNHLPLEEQLNVNLKEEKALEKYKLQRDLLTRRIQEIKEKLDEDKLTEEMTAKIVEEKNQLRAAMKIQRWWRKQLYEPGRGIFYLKSHQNFEKTKTQNQDTKS
jgi:hypothetical protein